MNSSKIMNVSGDVSDNTKGISSSWCLWVWSLNIARNTSHLAARIHLCACTTFLLGPIRNLISLKTKKWDVSRPVVLAFSSTAHSFCAAEIGADPGFPLGGGTKPYRGGANIQILAHFTKKKPHEIEKIFGRMGLRSTLRSAIEVVWLIALVSGGYRISHV